MGETINIARMAEKVATPMLEQFGWKQFGATNTNWKCVNPEEHSERNTKNHMHPTDAIYYYEHPYLDRRIYVNVDFKSYASPSISVGSVTEGATSLAQVVECASASSDFRDRYIMEADSESVVAGLLFIFNHDGKWDKDFAKIVAGINQDLLTIPEAREVYVFGPEQVAFLHNVSIDIRKRRGDGAVPARADCGWFYPDLVRCKRRFDRSEALALEAMTSPWITQQWTSDDRTHLCIYARGGDSVDEFMYMIDYLFKYQQVTAAHRIEIRVTGGTLLGSSSFEKARHQYAMALREFERKAVGARLAAITYQTIENHIPRFIAEDLGINPQ